MLPRSSLWARLLRRTDAALSEAEDAFNRLTDSDHQWWPFAFLRPMRNETFSTHRVAALAVLHGVPLGLLLVLVDPTARHAATGARLVTFLASVCAIIFVTNRFTLAYFWNRRVSRILRRRDTSSAEG